MYTIKEIEKIYINSFYEAKGNDHFLIIDHDSFLGKEITAEGKKQVEKLTIELNKLKENGK